jgi:hypothetical protein
MVHCGTLVRHLVARCAMNIMKVYFKNEKKPICIEIYYIHDFYFYL